MEVHFFISEKANEKDRLLSTLQPIISLNQTIHYHEPDDFGRKVYLGFNKPAAAVIMAGENEELTRLAERKGIWDKFKTILILRDDNPETISIGILLRPIFITYMESDFNEVAAIMDHIKNRFLN